MTDPYQHDPEHPGSREPHGRTPPPQPGGDTPGPSTQGPVSPPVTPPPAPPHGAPGGPHGPQGMPPWAMQQPPRNSGGSGFTRILGSIVASLLLISVLLNIYFGVIFASQLQDVAAVEEVVYREGDLTSRIAILPVQGMIDETTVVFVRQALDALRDDPPKALILRVESGGGGVGPSDQIWKQIQQFRANMLDQDPGFPIIASFGSIAASGGYYIAVDADAIFAEPTTITGSIGVVANLFTVGGMLDKIGVEPIVITAPGSPDKDLANDITRPWTEADRQVVVDLLATYHDRFVQLVQTGRGLDDAQIQEVTTGRVFTADKALAAGLVDRAGDDAYLDDAIQYAENQAGITTGEARVTIVQPRLGLANLFGLARQDNPAAALDVSRQMDEALRRLGNPRFDYRWTLAPSAIRPE